MATFFTADTHFGHANVIRHCARPFEDVHAMNLALTQTWNAAVRPGDVVYHLGDFAYRLKGDLGALFARLNGEKHLIAGNHDGQPTTALPWASVRDIAHVVVEGQRMSLCHYPLASWPHLQRGAIHLYGHVHGRVPATGHACDVGVDAWAMRPVSLDEIRARMAATRSPAADAFARRLDGKARGLVETAERLLPGWAADAVADAAARAMGEETDRILEQLTAQGPGEESR